MMTDPYRLSIIQVFKKTGDRSLTVQEIANGLGDPHGKVYYHVKKLENYGALEVDKTEVINGITAKYYKLTFDTLDIVNDPNEEIKNMVKVNETMKMIGKLYDDSRDDYLAFVQESETDDRPKEKNALKNEGFLSMATCYFTEENYPGFKEDILALIEKYSVEDADTTQIKKGIFLSVYTETDK